MIIVEYIINNIDIIIGMNVICELRGLIVKNGQVKFREIRCAVAAQEPNYFEDKNVKADFNSEKWTRERCWKGEPPVLENKMEC